MALKPVEASLFGLGADFSSFVALRNGLSNLPIGHFASGRRRHSGPFHQLSLTANSCAVFPHVQKSADLLWPGT